jgi:peroxiredoxin Q/BCP
LENHNVIVVGISRDSILSHKKFIEKYSLPFVLLSDPEGEVCSLYDVLKEKNMYGKKSIGIERSTFIIDESGMIRKIFRKVKVDGHIDEVLRAINTMD